MHRHYQMCAFYGTFDTFQVLIKQLWSLNLPNKCKTVIEFWLITITVSSPNQCRLQHKLDKVTCVDCCCQLVDNRKLKNQGDLPNFSTSFLLFLLTLLWEKYLSHFSKVFGCKIQFFVEKIGKIFNPQPNILADIIFMSAPFCWDLLLSLV